MLTSDQIDKAFCFARTYLRLRFSLTKMWAILPYDESRGWSGVYRAGFILFNGSPDLMIIFHEAVHALQHERGDNLKLAYSKIKTFEDYWNLPHEIEARNKAFNMMRQFHYPHPSGFGRGGLSSDHTYY